MKNLWILFTVGFLSIQAQAQYHQSIDQKAWTVAREIQDRSSYLSEQQKYAISQKLNEIRDIMANYNPYPTPQPPVPPPPPPSYGTDYVCVSRDNDGAAPYSLAVREGVNVSRLNLVYRTKADCENSLAQARSIGGVRMTCTSRDNDGQNPMLLVSLNGKQVQRFAETVVRSQSECTDLMSRMRTDRYGNTSLCVSRDKDGQTPFVAASLDIRSGRAQIGSETFRSIDECWRFLAN